MISMPGLTGGGILFSVGKMTVLFDDKPSRELSISTEKFLSAVEGKIITPIDGGGLLSFPTREIATITVDDSDEVNLEWEILLNKLRS